MTWPKTKRGAALAFTATLALGIYIDAATAAKPAVVRHGVAVHAGNPHRVGTEVWTLGTVAPQVRSVRARMVVALYYVPRGQRFNRNTPPAAVARATVLPGHATIIAAKVPCVRTRVAHRWQGTVRAYARLGGRLRAVTQRSEIVRLRCRPGLR